MTPPGLWLGGFAWVTFTWILLKKRLRGFYEIEYFLIDYDIIYIIYYKACLNSIDIFCVCDQLYISVLYNYRVT